MRLFIRSLALMLFLCWVPSALGAVNYENFDITRIDLRGNVNTDSSLIRALLSSRVGTRFSHRLVSRDVRDLYYLGFFSDIRVSAALVQGGVVLTYIFEEYDKVEAIEIHGNKELSANAIRDVMTLRKDSVFSATQLQRNIEAILEAYRRRGFRDVVITPSTRTDAETRRVYIRLDIREGNKLVIERISIIGAQQLKESTVKGAIEETRESGLFRSGVFDERNFERDKERIVQFYHNRGFIRMSITRSDVRIAPVRPGSQQQAIFLDIYVDEGKRYRMGEYTFEGNELFTNAEILRMFRLRTGAFFDVSQFERDQMNLWQAYRERGYIYTEITPLRNIDDQAQVVNIAYRIREREIAHIRHIFIRGNTRTRDYVIEREIRVKEGEIFNSSSIRRSQERLFNLRYFKDVNIEMEPVREHEGLIDLVFSVKEDRTGLFTLGAGYGTATGFSFFQQLAEHNLFGRGLMISQRGEWGQKRRSIMFGIDTPYLFTFNPTSLGFSISYSDTTIENISTNFMKFPDSQDMREKSGRNRYSFSRRAFEIQLRAGRSLSEWWRGFSSYTFGWVNSYKANFLPKSAEEATNLSPNAQEYVRRLRDALDRGYSTRSSARVGVLYDTRDFIGGPSRGIYASQFFSYTGGLLGGDSQWLMTESNFSFFVPLFWNFVFAVDTKYESIFNQFSGRSNIYPGDELQFDGMTELRGWREYYEAGRTKLSSMIELRYPIDRRMFWGVFFYDMGKLWDDHARLSFDLKEYKYSAGFGFRLQISVLPIRLYFARRMEYDADGKAHWHGGRKFFKGWETVFSVAGIF
jgi:outer membrane protein insertion porin family